MTDFSTLLAAYSLPLTLLISGATLLAIYLAFKEPLHFFFMDFFYGLPLIGKLRALAGDISKSKKTGWLISEETLCSDYRQYVNPISEREFSQRSEYLRKAGDTGRKPLSAILMIMLGVLIAAEALGFSFLLSTSMAQEGSANLHTLMTFAITSVIAIVFAVLMHAAGHQLHRSALIGRALNSWRIADKPAYDGEIDLAKDQSADDRELECVQLLKRVGDNKSYSAVIAAGILIAAVFFGSTYMRIQHLNGSLIQESVAAADAGGNPFADGKAGLPSEAVAPQEEALKRAKEESTGAAKGEGYAAFIILGVIFVFTQFVGVRFGMNYGFASKHGAEAHRLTLGFGTYEEYLRAFAPRIHKASARLRNLQQRIAADPANKNPELNGDFELFLERFTAVSKAAGPLPGAAAAPLSAVAAPAPAAAPEGLEQALAAIDALADVDEKKRYTANLPAELRAEVLTVLKARKAQAAAMAELDDAF